MSLIELILGMFAGMGVVLMAVAIVLIIVLIVEIFKEDLL